MSYKLPIEKGCGKQGKIQSEAQRRLFGAVASGNAKNKPEGLSKKEAKDALKEAKNKDLPEKVKKSGTIRQVSR